MASSQYRHAVSPGEHLFSYPYENHQQKIAKENRDEVWFKNTFFNNYLSGKQQDQENHCDRGRSQEQAICQVGQAGFSE
jgi:hypothetical protein